MDGGVFSSAACTAERQRCARRGVHGGVRLEEHKWRVGDLEVK